MPEPVSRRAIGGALLALGLAASSMLPGCAPAPAMAQRGQVVPDFADLSERVLPSVVSIAVTGLVAEIPPEFRGTPLERYFRGRRVQGAGSGFVVDPSGYIATNNHVVGSASSVVVQLPDGTELPARVVASDDLTDLALIKVEAPRPLPTVPWGRSSDLRVGEWLLAAGNPFGLGGSVTSGILSARGRDIGTGPFDDFLQTDAPINPGNSGGPLFNMRGELIGITTAIYSPSGASAGIGFAAPSDLARPVIEQLMRGGRVERGWLGVSVEDAEGRGGGVLVRSVERGSPAALAGLRQGDVVIGLNDSRIERARGLVRGVAGLPPGEAVRLRLLRNGRPMEVTVQVGRRPSRS